MINLKPLSKSISFYEHIGFKNLTRINPRLGGVKEHVMYKFTENFEKDDTILHRILSKYSWFGDGFLAMAVIEHAKFINSEICSRINDAGKTCMDLTRDNAKVDRDVIDAINARCAQGGSSSKSRRTFMLYIL
jgi:hypothetical protein